MKNYTHFYFDLDHTLWDYERNSRATLSLLYSRNKLDEQAPFTLNQFVDVFTRINEKLWGAYHVGEIEQDHIRKERFPMIFKELDYAFSNTETMSREYIEECPRMGYTLPGAIELLNHLKDRYHLSIITNGFKDIQGTKLQTTGLDAFFEDVFISGNTAYRKPDRELFLIALDQTGGHPEQSVMVGDSLESDIRGAKNVPMDQVFFNPHSTSHDEEVTFEISQLLQIRELGF